MSTKSQIGVNGTDIKVFAKFDSQPKYLIPIIINVVKMFIKERGYNTDDSGYLLANVLKGIVLERNKDDNINNLYIMDYSISDNLRSDITFYYKVDISEGLIEVYKNTLEYEDMKDNLQFMKSFKITEVDDIDYFELEDKKVEIMLENFNKVGNKSGKNILSQSIYDFLEKKDQTILKQFNNLSAEDQEDIMNIINEKLKG